MTEHREPFSDKNTMERKLRILLELLCLLGFGLLFLDIHGLWSEHLAWLGKIQLIGYIYGANAPLALGQDKNGLQIIFRTFTDFFHFFLPKQHIRRPP